MTSKDKEIQYLYDKIKSFDPFIDWSTLNQRLITLLSIENKFKSDSLCWGSPLKKIQPNDLTFGTFNYQIVFFEYGIRISMTRDMIKKIGILNSIILEGNGSDKPLRLKYLDNDENELDGRKTHDGPYLYLTKLPMNSLLFNEPPASYNVMSIRGSLEPTSLREMGYFKYKNLEETIVNERWYS